MALIKCPECGRENVSDKAEMCPNCGYGIKSHFNQLSENQIVNIDEDNNSTNDKKTVSDLTTCDDIKIPPKPQFPIMGTFIFSVLWILFIWFTIQFEVATLSTGTFIVLGIMLLVPTIFGIYITYWRYSDYRLATTNFEEYKNKQLKTQKEIAEFQEKMQKEREEKERIRLQTTPKCPVCNSTDVERITTTSRAVSVATVGLASGKIGKQYKCKNCKHMW